MEWTSVKIRLPAPRTLCWVHRAGHPGSPWPGYYRGNDTWEILDADGEAYSYVFKKKGFVTHFISPPLPPAKGR